LSDDSNDIKALERAAKVYSVAGDYGKSVQIFEKLVETEPNNWTYIYDLIVNLHNLGNDTDADELHSRAIVCFPNEFWIVYSWILYAWVKRNYSDADQRSMPVLSLLTRLPSKLSDDQKRIAFGLLGSLSMKRHAFLEAVSYFRHAYSLAPQDPTLAKLVAHANLCVRAYGPDKLTSSVGRVRPRRADYNVLVINLDRDTERFQNLCIRFRNSPIDLERLPGVYGSYLPRVALAAMRISSLAGTAGCMLSHVKAWETVVTRGLEVCLVIEDDALPLINLPDCFKSLGVPSDFDICFINERMEPILDVETVDNLPGVTFYAPIQTFITRPPDYNGPGADGYFISAKGARRLLSFIERDGLNGDVDWRLVQYSVPYENLDSLVGGSTAHAIIAQMENVPRERLKAYTIFPSLISHESNSSSRHIENYKN
jgi:GR25 family glycosyltransferase involved in LPS biosynthesis